MFSLTFGLRHRERRSSSVLVREACGAHGPLRFGVDLTRFGGQVGYVA